MALKTSGILLACLICAVFLNNVNALSPTDPADTVQQRVAAKVERVYEAARQWAASGRNPSAIAKTMKEQVKPLLEAGKFSEAETALDRVLEQLKPDGKSTEPPTATPGSSKAPAMSEELKYLIFWSSPEKAGKLVEQIGMKGDGKTRLLGFGLPNATFELEEQLPSHIRSAFAAAREHNMAVMLHFDFHLFWKNRPDLWNWFDPSQPGYNSDNKYNVEWHGWDGPPNKVRYLNHGVLERKAPHMCFTSKRIRAEITRIVSKVIGPVLREEIAKLKAEGKEALFAGVLVGLEPGIDDYSKPNPETMKMMKEDDMRAGPLGYRALLDRGFGADRPPDDFRQALATIIQETVAFWCEQFVDAGIPTDKLYPHVAAPAPIEMTNAPIWTAFNKYSRPGWTTYAVLVLGGGFKPIYDELEKHGNPAWGGVEANAGFDGSVVDWETYLAWHYNHGCILVGVNMGATGKDLPRRLWDSAFSKEAIAAYRKFLTGQPLAEKPLSMDKSPTAPAQAERLAAQDISEELLSKLTHNIGSSFLVFRDKVQGELKVTKEQKEKLDQHLRELLPEVTHVLQKSKGERDKYNQKTHEDMAAVLKQILDEGQLTRLRQLQRQRDGLFGDGRSWKELQVTDEQQKQFMALIQQTGKETVTLMEQIHKGANPDEIRPKVLALRASLEGRLEALLTDAQKNQWKQMLGEPVDLSVLFDGISSR